MEAASSVAACCAAFYEQDWVRTLLGDHFHPGGAALTRRLVADLALVGGERVLDLACGTGRTARLLTESHDGPVVGLDFSAANLLRAQQLAPVATFVQGSADALPFADRSVDAVICECAVSTFAHKPAVAAEVARVLTPGGRLAMSDMCVHGALPEDLAAFGRGWSCVDDALTEEGYDGLFTNAGLVLEHTIDESDTLVEMLVMLKKKLLVASIGEATGFTEMGADLPTIRDMLARARTLVRDRRVRYVRLLFRGESRI